MSAATATKEAKEAKAAKATELASLLGAESLPLEDVRRVVDDLTIARAWSAGDVEFGHRRYCVTGPVGKIGSTLVVEDGWEWSGPKTKMHASFREIVADEIPKTDKAKKYELQKPERFGEEPALKGVEIPREEAERLVALHVRLTDKGLAGE